MATVNLGAIKFNWKGAYNNSTAYAVDDVVSSSGSSYVCILASQGNAVSNGTYWNIMSSAGTNGTNGTDIGTTLTTQGDMLYRDGSGLQRLAKGTASQELRMNSGATAPEWHTPAVASSDFVHIATGQGNGSSDTIALNSCFSATYDYYKVYATIFTSQTATAKIRLQNSSNGEITSNYRFSGTLSYQGSTDAITHFQQSSSDTFNPQESTASHTYRYSAIDLTIYRPFDSTAQTFLHINQTQEDGSFLRRTDYAGYLNSAETNAGIRIFVSGGNMPTLSKMSVYGIKS